MTHKLFIALDSSEGAWRAVEYVADTFGSTPGVQVTLLHILSSLPPAFWDDGHILGKQEQESRQRSIGSWEAEQEKQWQGLVKKAHDHLAAAAIPKESVSDKFKPKYLDVAEGIISEATTGGFDTVVMGRRGLGLAKSLYLGSVTTKVVQHARGLAITIVE